MSKRFRKLPNASESIPMSPNGSEWVGTRLKAWKNLRKLRKNSRKLRKTSRKYCARKTDRKSVRKSARKYFRIKVYSFTYSFYVYAYENIFRGDFRANFRSNFRAQYFRNIFSISFSRTKFSWTIFVQFFAQDFRAKISWGFSRQGVVWVVGVGVLVMWQTSYQEGYVLRGIKDHTVANRISWPCHMHHTLCYVPVTQGPRFSRMLCFDKKGSWWNDSSVCKNTEFLNFVKFSLCTKTSLNSAPRRIAATSSSTLRLPALLGTRSTSKPAAILFKAFTHFSRSTFRADGAMMPKSTLEPRGIGIHLLGRPVETNPADISKPSSSRSAHCLWRLSECK